MKLAKHGIQQALRSDKDIHDGVNTHLGRITYKGVAESQGKPSTPLSDLL
jgi:alanine dehydrogenase